MQASEMRTISHLRGVWGHAPQGKFGIFDSQTERVLQRPKFLVIVLGFFLLSITVPSSCSSISYFQYKTSHFAVLTFTKAPNNNVCTKSS